MRWRRNFLRVAAVLALVAGVGAALAQFQRGSRRGFRGGGEGPTYGGFIVGEEGTLINEETVRTAREVVSHSTGTPNWTNAPGFEQDAFTFARVLFRLGATSNRGFGRGWRLGWWVDFPDADLNLSFRLQQLTAMKVDPDCRVVRLTEPGLNNYPFL